MRIAISKIDKEYRDIDVIGKIIIIESEREVLTKWGKNRVMNSIIEDDTGRIKLTLWGKDIDLVKEGDTVTIKNAFISKYNDELQVNVPRNGSIEVKKVIN